MKFLLKDQETERLLFRKLEYSDFDKWLNLFEDENTVEMLGMSEFQSAKNVARNGLNGLLRDTKMIWEAKMF